MNTQKTGRSKLISQAVAFFQEHAGWSYNPKTETAEQGKLRGAKALAKAERDAASKGLTFEWTDEGVRGCIGCDCGSDECPCSERTEHECFAVVVYNPDGEVVASLGSVCSPSREYRRVVQAELALEALNS